MANINAGLTIRKNAVQQAEKKPTIKGLLSESGVKKRFEELLGKKAPGFISSLLSVCNNNKLLQKANPETVVAAGAMAAALDLPINQNLGFAYIIPYGHEAQFQLGYKGYVQLAMRTGLYKTITANVVHEGEIRSYNRFTDELEFGERTSDDIVGYLAYFKLTNGFEKYVYMTVEEMEAHARKYSKAYKGGKSWGVADFDSMATKTVLKRLLSKYGILSIEMSNPLATALAFDGAVVREGEDGNPEADFDGVTEEFTGETVDTVIEVNEEPSGEFVETIME